VIRCNDVPIRPADGPTDRANGSDDDGTPACRPAPHTNLSTVIGRSRTRVPAVIHGIGDRGRHRDSGQLAEALGTERAGFLIELDDEEGLDRGISAFVGTR
jgi:hypothetical protein